MIDDRSFLGIRGIQVGLVLITNILQDCDVFGQQKPFIVDDWKLALRVQLEGK